ncbi:hypothetical protein Tco_1087485 [Tanacetum coccineum]
MVSLPTLWKQIFDKRTKNKAKNDKTRHGMEKRGKAKVQKVKVNQVKVKVNPEKSKGKSRVKIYDLGLQDEWMDRMALWLLPHTRNTSPELTQ